MKNPSRRLIFCIGAAGLAVAISATPARANLVLNGDFEGGNLYSWTTSGTVAALSDSGSPSVPAFGSQSLDGSNAAVFNYGTQNSGNAVLSQVLSTVAGQAYILTFDFGTQTGQDAMNVKVSDKPSGSLDMPTVNVAAIMNDPDNLDVFSYKFVAQSALSKMQFLYSYSDDGSNPAFLDNVDVEAVVPEPPSLATGGMFMATVAAAALAGRSRRGLP